MFLFAKKITMSVHNGSFHADDVFACAVMSIWAEKNNYNLKIIRTRDPEILNKSDIVADVGGVYDPDADRFDHHQKEGAGFHENGIPYAAFGLTWKKYGEFICGNKEVASIIENNVVIPIDARDNGVMINIPNEKRVFDFRVGEMISNFNPTWQEDIGLLDKYFNKALDIAIYVIKREIECADAKVKGDIIVEQIIKEQHNPEILIIDRSVEWEETVSKFKNIKFVVYKSKSGDNWNVQVGRDDVKDYTSDRINFPFEWRGLRDGELSYISGIEDAVFCANGGWFGVAKTKDGAIKMAEKVLHNV